MPGRALSVCLLSLSGLLLGATEARGLSATQEHRKARRAVGGRLRSRGVLRDVGLIQPQIRIPHTTFFRAFLWGFQPVFVQFAPGKRERELASFSWELKPGQLSQLPPQVLFLDQDCCFSPAQPALCLPAGF